MQQSNIDAFEQANTRHLYLDIAWMGVAWAMEWYFLQVYAIRLGATPAHLASLTSLRALFMVIGSGLAGRWGSRYHNMIDAIRIPAITYRLLLYLGIAFVAFLPAYKVDALVALAVLSAIPTGITQGCFLGMIRTALPEDKLAKVVARRSVLMNALILVFVVIFGQLLENLPFPINYQIGFGLAFVASAFSWWNMMHVKTPDVQRQAETGQPTSTINVWKNPVFVRFMITVLLICVGVFMSAPLVQLYLVRDLNASDSWISFFGMFEMAAGALITLRIDRLTSRFGTSRLIIIMTFATFFQTSILGVITTLPPYIIAELLFGAGWFALGVLLFNRLVELVPQQDFPAYAATYQVVINVALFVGPLIGSFLIEHDISLPAALLITAGVRFIAGIFSWAADQKNKAVPLAEMTKTV